MRKLKKLTRYLLGKVDVYPQLTPNHHAEVSNVPVGSYGADKKKGDTSKVQWRSSALLRVRGAHIRTISDNQSFVSCRSRVVWNRLVSGRGAGFSRTSYKSGIQIAGFFGDRLTLCDSCMPTQGTWQKKTRRAGDACIARVVEEWKAEHPLSINARQPRQPHHESYSQEKLRNFRRALNLRESSSIQHTSEQQIGFGSSQCSD